MIQARFNAFSSITVQVLTVMVPVTLTVPQAAGKRNAVSKGTTCCWRAADV